MTPPYIYNGQSHSYFINMNEKKPSKNKGFKGHTIGYFLGPGKVFRDTGILAKQDSFVNI